VLDYGPTAVYLKLNTRGSHIRFVGVFFLINHEWRLTDNPTLMRLRELEVLEKIASTGKTNILLGEKGLADKVVNLL